MNDKRLRIYLEDHLAMMLAETELAGRCWRNNRAAPLGELLQLLENEVRAQQSIARDIIHRIGSKETVESRLKQGAAWLVEKLGRLKRNDSILKYSELSRVVELETLSAAAQERFAMWDNLHAVAESDSRLDGITFSFFRDQSLQHLNELNCHRRLAAVAALLGQQSNV